MKTNYIFLSVLIAILTGFLLGRYTSGSGRYTFENKNNQVAIFDTKTGEIYVKDNNESSSIYFKIDVINAEVKHYKTKK